MQNKFGARHTHTSRSLVASGGRNSSVDRNVDIRRDLHVVERKLSAFGTTPHETNTRNTRNTTQSFVLSVPAPSIWNGDTGKCSMAKCDVESTCVAPNKIMARETDVMVGANSLQILQDLGKQRKTTPVEWRDKEQIRDGPKHRKHKRFYTDGQGTWQGQTRTRSLPKP